MSKYKLITYYNKQFRVKRPVNRCLKADEKRAWRERHWDRDHRSDMDIERYDLDSHLRDRPVPFEDRIADNSEAAYVRHLLGALTKTQRRRVRMYFFDRLTYQQIADYEGTDEGTDESTIRGSIKKSLKKLKNFFKD